MQLAEMAISNMVRSVNPALIHEDAKRALQLEQFRCFDFSSMTAELQAVFRLTSSKIQLRHVPLAYRVAVDGAGPYDKRPVREFGTPSEVVASRWREVYEQLGVDEVLQELEQAGTLQQAYLVGCWPDRRGRLQLHPFLPFEVVALEFDDPTSSRLDFGDVSSVVLARTLHRPNALGIVSPWVSLIHLSREEAWQYLPDGTKIGLFAPDGSHPLGILPVVATRRVRPAFSARTQRRGGDWFPTHAQDVLSCQIGIILACSHMEYTTRSQTHNKVIASGEEAADLPQFIEDRPDGVMVLPGEVSVQSLQLNPPIERYIRAVETTVYYLSQFRYLRPEAYAASIVTGSARRADALGFEAQQERQEMRCVRLEERLKTLVALAYNATQGTAVKLDPDSPLKVTHRHVRPAENALQEAQARALKLQQLMGSVVEDIAREEGVTETEARQVAMRRLDDFRAFATSSATPGLDRLRPEEPTDQDPTTESADADGED